MPMQQWFFVRNEGEDRMYMHGALRRVPGKFLLIAPGFIAPVVNGKITWPHGAIICVDRLIWGTSPALGKYPWAVQVTQDDFVAALRADAAAPVVRVAETSAIPIDADLSEAPTPQAEDAPVDAPAEAEAERKQKRRWPFGPR